MQGIALKRLIRTAAPATVLAVLVSACGGGSGQEATSSSGPETAKTLTVSISSDEGTLTPYTNQTGYPGSNLVDLIFDSLVRLDEKNEVQPLLATELQANSDNTEFTLPLREGVTWQDGKPFTAEDVVFSVQFYQQFSAADSAVSVEGVGAVRADGNSVVITLTAPDPEFPVRTLADMPIMPKHLWSSVTDPQSADVSKAVGTGPYKLVKYDTDVGYTFEANPSYAMGTPKVDELRVVVIPEQQTQLAALRTGEVDMTTRVIPPQLIEELRSQEDIGLAEGPDFASTLLLFNTGRAPFDRPEVRAALAKAIDVQDLVDTVLLGQGSPGNPGFLHPDGPIQGDQLEPVYDAEAAADELDALGAEPGADGVRVLDGKPMSYELLVQSTSPDRLRSAELISEMLQKVGVTVTVRSMDSDSLDAQVWPDYDVTQGRDYDMSMWGWSAPTMFDSTKIASLVATDPLVGRLNVVGLNDTEINQLTIELLASPTIEGRTEKAKELQAAIADTMPFVTLYYKEGVYAFRKDVFDGWVYQEGAGIFQKLSLTSFTI